jgi:preprotein translocase subunit SecD
VNPARLGRRLVVTAASVVVAGLAILVPAAGIDHEVLEMIGRGAAGGAVRVGPFSVGLRPFLLSFVIVELLILLVRPRRRHGDPAFRRGMTLASVALGIALALVQGWSQALYLEALEWSSTWGMVVSLPGVQFRIVHALSVAAGSCVLLALASWVTRRGVGSGFAVLLGADLVVAALAGARDLATAVLSSMASPFQVALAVLLWGALLAMLVWLFARQGVRDLSLPVVLPTCGSLPLEVAFAVSMLPVTLSNFTGLEALQAVSDRTMPGTPLGWAVTIVVMAATVPLASYLFYFRRRQALMEPAARPAWLRAWLLSGAGLLGVVLATSAIARLAPSAQELGPTALTFLVAAAIAVDLAREVRARWRARAAGDDLQPIAVHQDVADALEEASRLGPERAVVVQGLCFRSLTYVFGPYVPLVVLADGRMGSTGPMGPTGQPGTEAPRAGGASAGALMSIVAAVLICAVALGPVLWAAAGRQTLGLDFEGGVLLVLEPAGPEPREGAALEQVRRVADRLGGDVAVFERAGAIHLEVAGATGEDLARVVEAVTRPVDLRLLPVVGVPGLGPEVTAPDEASLRARLDLAGPLLQGTRVFIEPVFEGVRAVVASEEPVITGADVTSATTAFDPYDGRPRVEVELTPAGGERFHQYTRDHVGQMIAIVVDGELDSAPVIQGPIPGGRIQITMGGDSEPGEAVQLALRLSAGAGVPMTVAEQTVITPTMSPWLGRPLAIVLTVLALLACCLAAIRRRWPEVAVATGLLGAALGLAGPGLLDATLTGASLAAAAAVGLLAASPVALSGLRQSPRPGLAGRLAASWPAWAAIGACAAGAALLSPALHGFARGVAMNATIGLLLVIPVAVVALAALAPRRAAGS